MFQFEILFSLFLHTSVSTSVVDSIDFNRFHPFIVGILRKQDLSKGVVEAFNSYHAVGFFVSTQWVVSSMSPVNRYNIDQEEVKKWTADQFNVYQTQSKGARWYFNEVKFYSVSKIVTNPKFEHKSSSFEHEGFLLKLTERIPYGVALMQWHAVNESHIHRRPYIIYFHAFHENPSNPVMVGQLPVEMVPSEKCQVGDEKFNGYCALMVNHHTLPCDKWFHSGAALFYANQIYGFLIDGGQCMPFSQLPMRFHIVDVLFGNWDWSKYIRENVYDDEVTGTFYPESESIKIPPTNSSGFKPDLTTLAGNGNISSYQRRKRIKMTSPLPRVWLGWGLEDCGQFSRGTNFTNSFLVLILTLSYSVVFYVE